MIKGCHWKYGLSGDWENMEILGDKFWKPNAVIGRNVNYNRALLPFSLIWLTLFKDIYLTFVYDPH